MGLEGTYTALPDERIRRLAAGEESLLDVDPDEHERLNIGSVWEVLHYVLTEECEDGEPPLGYIVPMQADQTLPAGDLDACFLTLDQVRQALEALNAITESEFRSLYDFDRMREEEVYTTSGMTEPDREPFFVLLHRRLQEIRVFYERCAQAGSGVVFHLS